MNCTKVLVCVTLFALTKANAADLSVERRKPMTANVGIVSVGLDTYWKQSPGLLDDMVKKEDVFVRKCEAHQVKVSRFGMSDNPIAAKAMIPAMKAADLDVLRKWSLEGPTHHFALGVGRHAAELKKLGKALGVETVVVTP